MGCIVPQIALVIAPSITEVKVELSQIEIAQEQIKEQEKQRVLGIIPNFYVSYVPDASPLTSKQKFELAWKSTVDPVRYLTVGVIAGVDQATNRFSGYGQGAQGYAKRYGASYANYAVGTFIGSAILPSSNKIRDISTKEPGARMSRFLYAIAISVICKGDNGHWQPNYSERSRKPCRGGHFESLLSRQ